MAPKVLILLSSYNGEQFIREQIDSILNQDNVDFYILIRDDGSTDSTPEILKYYKEKKPDNIQVIYGDNIGWKQSFFELLKIAESHFQQYEYFAFSDQDDIWLPNKMFAAIKCLSSLSDPLKLYFSNLYYYKNGTSYGKIWKSTPIVTAKRCLLVNNATGCTMVFSKDLLKLLVLKPHNLEVAHDFWTYQTAVLCGDIYTDDNAYIYYRQHANNQIGSRTGVLNTWKRRIKSFRATLHDHIIESQSKSLFETYQRFLTEEGREALVILCNYRKNIRNKKQLLLDSNYSLNSKVVL